MAPEDQAKPEPYEAGQGRSLEEVPEDELGDRPTREQLEEHNRKLAGAHKPPPESQAEEEREAPVEEGPAPDVPQAPPPEPADS
jgi:hypothetical protein